MKKAVFLSFVLVFLASNSALAEDRVEAKMGGQISVGVEDDPFRFDAPSEVFLETTPSGMSLYLKNQYFQQSEGDCGLLAVFSPPESWVARESWDGKTFQLQFSGSDPLDPQNFFFWGAEEISYSADIKFSFDGYNQSPVGVEGKITINFKSSASGKEGWFQMVVALSPAPPDELFPWCFSTEIIPAEFEVYPRRVVLKKGRFIWGNIFSPVKINLSTIRVGPLSFRPVVWRVWRHVVVFIPDVTKLGVRGGETELCFEANSTDGQIVGGCGPVDFVAKK